MATRATVSRDGLEYCVKSILTNARHLLVSTENVSTDMTNTRVSATQDTPVRTARKKLTSVSRTRVSTVNAKIKSTATSVCATPGGQEPSAKSISTNVRRTLVRTVPCVTTWSMAISATVLHTRVRTACVRIWSEGSAASAWLAGLELPAKRQ
jgi:hypothetical protein